MLKVIMYGGIVIVFDVFDWIGYVVDIVFGFDLLCDYEVYNGNIYFGVLIGWYVNCIVGGCFMFGGKMWKLLVNDGLNMLYGGFDSFDVKVWMVIGMYSDVIGLSVMLCYVSFDGENGFFGMLMIDVIYMLICDN